jgi:tripartite-type tricarboxylate transporter receptor subunit TctC
VEAGFANADFAFWVGAFVPKATPRELVATIHSQVVAAIESAAVKERLSKLGVEPMIMSPADFDARVAKEAGIAVQLAKAANIAVQ